MILIFLAVSHRHNMLLITDLPPEIRNIIYEIVVADDRPILVRRRHCLELGQSGRCALTQASHQIRVESLPIYYSTNIFELAAIRDFKRWLSVVGDSCQYLRRLQFMDGMIEGLSWKMTSPTPRINLVSRIAREMRPTRAPNSSVLLDMSIGQDSAAALGLWRRRDNRTFADLLYPISRLRSRCDSPALMIERISVRAKK